MRHKVLSRFNRWQNFFYMESVMAEGDVALRVDFRYFRMLCPHAFRQLLHDFGIAVAYKRFYKLVGQRA